MTTLRRALALLPLLLLGCATALPPPVAVTDLRALAGTYRGPYEEAGELKRSADLVLEPDGHFELRASDPKGFRTLGQIVPGPGGTLRYGFKELRGSDVVLRGAVAVHEGDGRRVIVLTTPDDKVRATLERSLP
jgi:hypothetical protein